VDVERCNAAAEAAALRIKGRLSSKHEATGIIFKPGRFR